ncbi:MAG: hypothetical protein NT002_00295 [candidate division Zixibacteria bacterium]|nr:hypothetical protein [candidate division Zixibacteria bacterium]
MKPRNSLIGGLMALVLLFALPASNVSADIKMDFSGSSGYTSNLLSDSSRNEDSFSSTKVSLRAYPHSTTEISFNNDYTYYSKFYNLSSFIGGFGLRFIPTGKKSPLSILFSLNFSARVYRDNFLKFNNDNYDALFSAGYNWRGILFRSGVSYNSMKYHNPAVPDSLRSDSLVVSDKNTFKLFAGTNFALLNSISIDFEGGYAYMDYTRFRDTIGYINPSHFKPVDSFMTGDRLESYYFSPRISGQLGAKVGLNVTYNYRKFANKKDKVVYGPGTGWISPWALHYEGQSITASLKTYYLPHSIISSGIGYWDKTFFRSIDELFVWLKDAHKRRDFQTRFYLSLQRPIPLKSGTIVEPFLQFDYSDNKSSYKLYDYSSLSVSAGLTIKM